MKKIKIHVSKEGNTKIETEGFTGQECQNATKELEKALGAVKNESFTYEYYQQNTTTNRLHTNGHS